MLNLPSFSHRTPILIEHGSNPNLQNALGQTALHLLAERAVRELQQRTAVGERPSESEEGDGEGGEAQRNLPVVRMLDNLAGGQLTLALDAVEFETGNTALRAHRRAHCSPRHHPPTDHHPKKGSSHAPPQPREQALPLPHAPPPHADIAAFGGCIELAEKLVGLGASVGLPNKDGFTPLDSMQPTGIEGKPSLSALLLNRISKPSSWVPDRNVSACQQCKVRLLPSLKPARSRPLAGSPESQLAAEARKRPSRLCNACGGRCSARHVTMGSRGVRAPTRCSSRSTAPTPTWRASTTAATAVGAPA